MSNEHVSVIEESQLVTLQAEVEEIVFEELH
jgi:hypothetical protein